MKKLLLFISAAIVVIAANAQTKPFFKWVATAEGPQTQDGRAIISDGKGGVYVAGRFTDTITLDPGLQLNTQVSNGNYDAFIKKVDELGNYKWGLVFGGTGYDDASALVADAAGNIYITGSFSGTVDFDPGAGTANLTAGGTYDIFVLKLDALGNYIWAKKFGSTSSGSYDYGTGIAVDTAANIYVTGSFQGTADFDPGPATANLTAIGDADVFVLKLDSAANYGWAVRFGGNSSLVGDEGNAIAIDALGNVITTGIFYGTGDFDPGPATLTLTATAANYADMFISKLDTGGGLIWVKQITGSNDKLASSIAIDQAGSIYTTGNFGGTIDMDPSPATANLTVNGGYFDIFILKFDSAGNFGWTRQLGGRNNLQGDMGMCIRADTSGHIYTSGSFRDTADFDQGIGVFQLVAKDIDGYLASYDTAGNFEWAMPIGGNGMLDMVNSIALDTGGTVYAAGFLSDTVYFPLTPSVDLEVISRGGTDAFMCKLGPASVSVPSSIKSDELSIYPNPTTGIFHMTTTVGGYVEVYTVAGVRVYTQKVAPGTNSIDISAHANGIYILQLRDEKGKASIVKMIKQ